MRIIIILVLLSSLLSLNAKALAVASDYLENNMLVLEEGASTIYSIRLQNTESYEAAYKVDYDKNFLKPIEYKEQYIVEPKSSYRIEFNVTAPAYDHKDQNNNLLTLGYTVHQLTGQSGGGIPFLTKINKNFKLKVIKNPNKLYINYLSVGYIAVLLLLTFFLLKKCLFNKNISKKKKQQKIK